MAKRQNYGFQKRQKELKKQKKREAKLEKKQARREDSANSGSAEGGERDEE